MNFNFTGIILEAIHILCSTFENIPVKDIELSISKWMAQASNHLKKRDEKFNKTNSQF